MKIQNKIINSVISRIKNLPHFMFQKPRIWKYKLLSSANHVQGKGRHHQPVLFLGAGKIVIGENINFGFNPSPYLYSGYIHIEARNHTSEIVIGDNCWLNNNCVIISEGTRIEIGTHCLFGTNVEIYDSDFHDLNPKKRMGVVAP